MDAALLDPNLEPTPLQIQLGVLNELEISINAELVELEEALHRRPVNAVAWISRNLIELAVWTSYCVESPKNAKLFLEDCARDAIDLLSKVPKGMSKDPDYDFEAARDEIVREGEAKGAERLVGPYERVAKAAETITRPAEFFWMNKVLSKFAHPTALWVMMSTEQLEILRDLLHSAGAKNGDVALRTIEIFRKRSASTGNAEAECASV